MIDALFQSTSGNFNCPMKEHSWDNYKTIISVQPIEPSEFFKNCPLFIWIFNMDINEKHSFESLK